jgi:hypothetical protein
MKNHFNTHAFRAGLKQIGMPLFLSALFLAVLCFALGSPGLYHDELHQAVSAFAWKGIQVPFFNDVSFRGFPVMNMTYIGAVKSNLYGLYLFVSDRDFSVLSWRLTGVLIAGVSFFIFTIMVRRQMDTITLVLFSLMFISDLAVLFTVRYDWGPVALALGLRLLFLGVWIRGESEHGPGRLNSLVLGVIAGFSAFEKLSSVVLVIPLAIMLLSSSRRRTLPHLASASLGYVLGCLPLIVVNVQQLILSGNLYSWSDVGTIDSGTFPGFAGYLYRFIGLGSGTLAKSWICGTATPGWLVILETALLAALLLICLVRSLQPGRMKHPGYTAAVSLACYGALCGAIFLLPRHTWIHHWIIATPFQYVAIAFTFMAINLEHKTNPSAGAATIRRLNILAILAFLVIRAYLLAAAEKDLYDGKTSSAWSAEYTRLATSAASQPADACFIAVEWGLTTQVFCMGNGRTRITEFYPRFEPSDSLELLRMLSGRDCSQIYLLQNEPPSRQSPDNLRRILAVISRYRDWMEVAPGREFQFRNIKVLKFRKTGPGGIPQNIIIGKYQ